MGDETGEKKFRRDECEIHRVGDLFVEIKKLSHMVKQHDCHDDPPKGINSVYPEFFCRFHGNQKVYCAVKVTVLGAPGVNHERS